MHGQEVADRIRSKETMADCWETSDKLYYRPPELVKGLMAEITAFKKMQDTEYERLHEYYVALRVRIREAEREGFLSLLLKPKNLTLIESSLPTRELKLWGIARGKEGPSNLGKILKEFIAQREEWMVGQFKYSTTPPLSKRGAVQTPGLREQPTPAAAINQQPGS
jgi:hypothetical protein